MTLNVASGSDSVYVWYCHYDLTGFHRTKFYSADVASYGLHWPNGVALTNVDTQEIRKFERGKILIDWQHDPTCPAGHDLYRQFLAQRVLISDIRLIYNPFYSTFRAAYQAMLAHVRNCEQCQRAICFKPGRTL